MTPSGESHIFYRGIFCRCILPQETIWALSVVKWHHATVVHIHLLRPAKWKLTVKSYLALSIWPFLVVYENECLLWNIQKQNVITHIVKPQHLTIKDVLPVSHRLKEAEMCRNMPNFRSPLSDSDLFDDPYRMSTRLWFCDALDTKINRDSNRVKKKMTVLMEPEKAIIS